MTAIKQWKTLCECKRWRDFWQGPYKQVIDRATAESGVTPSIDSRGQYVRLSTMLFGDKKDNAVPWRVAEAFASPEDIAKDPTELISEYVREVRSCRELLGHFDKEEQVCL